MDTNTPAVTSYKLGCILPDDHQNKKLYWFKWQADLKILQLEVLGKSPVVTIINEGNWFELGGGYQVSW